MRLLRVVAQVILLVCLWLTADWVVRSSALPIPAGVLGLGMLVLLLLLGWLPLDVVELGAELLLAEMMLFFVPAMVGLTRFGPLFAQQGWELLAVLLIGCLVVMAGTAWVVDHLFHYEQRLHASRDAEGRGK
ncbi:CidA/LrgA family protein [Burkholderiaceae bacterium DAT-1]|nr:CidA/LrgA family protein [Burkholderiaceae bacterium DAT-1]